MKCATMVRKIIPVTAAGIMAAAVLIGATGGPASASSGDSELCINPPDSSPYCAFDPEDIGLTSQYGVIMDQTDGSEWVYPTTSYTIAGYSTSSNTGSISEPPGGLGCLQIDQSDSDVVRFATCDADDAEMWINYYNSTTQRTEFVSAYYYPSDTSAGQYLCLSFDESGTDVRGATEGDIPRADPCNPPDTGFTPTNYWYQQWGTS
jgi:hypothetical protein